MNDYYDIFKIIYKRTRALLGKDGVIPLFKSLDLIVFDGGKIRLINRKELTYERLENLVNELNRKIGPIVILAFRIPVKRKARKNNLKLPALFL